MQNFNIHLEAVKKWNFVATPSTWKKHMWWSHAAQNRPPPRQREEKKILQQGCQIFLGPNIPKREKYTKSPQTIPNGHKLGIPNGRKIFQMVIKYTNIFHHSKAFQNLPKVGFLV
jgi:hypothetical protein